MARFVALENIAAGLVYDTDTNTCRRASDPVPPASTSGSATRSAAPASAERRALSIWMQVAEDCNLRCTYCYAAHGSYGMTRNLMSWSHAQAICEYLLRRLRTDFDALKVVFFGGEPLMNFDVIARAVALLRDSDEARAKPVSLAVSTNGLLLSHTVRQFIVENGINLLVSIDGSRETHDRHRHDPSGRGSYEEIMANCRAFFEYRDRRTIQASVTYSRDDLDLAGRIRSLEDAGFVNIKLEPVWLAEGHPLAFRLSDVDAVGDSVEQAARYCRDRAFAGSKTRVEPFAIHLPLVARGGRLRHHCAAGVNDLAISSDGRIYPCARLTGQSEWLLGNVHDGIDEAKTQAWAATEDLSGRMGCEECWARALCGGGCRVDSIERADSIAHPDEFMCALMKRTCTASLWLYDEFRHASARTTS